MVYEVSEMSLAYPRYFKPYRVLRHSARLYGVRQPELLASSLRLPGETSKPFHGGQQFPAGLSPEAPLGGWRVLRSDAWHTTI